MADTKDDFRREALTSELIRHRPLWPCAEYTEPVSGWLGEYCSDCYYEQQDHLCRECGMYFREHVKECQG